MEILGHKAFLDLGQTSQDDCSIKSFGLEEIELDVCSYAFIRGFDERGKIQTDLRGGNISFVISKLPSNNILDWGINSNKYLSGIISFRSTNGYTTGRVLFNNAACVNMRISYANEGQAYVMVQCTLQAETITLETIDPNSSHPLDNYWPNNDFRQTDLIDSSSEKTKDKVEGQAKKALNIDDSSLSAYMTLGAKDYELKSFEMEFSQEIDHLGQPQNDVVGGFACVSLYLMPDAIINKWLINKEGMNGFFQFGDPMIGFKMRIDFKEARCIGCYVECNNNSNENISTRLNIASELLVFNGLIRYSSKS